MSTYQIREQFGTSKRLYVITDTVHTSLDVWKSLNTRLKQYSDGWKIIGKTGGLTPIENLTLGEELVLAEVQSTDMNYSFFVIVTCTEYTAADNFDVVSWITRFESGDMNYGEMVDGFQHLLDTGIINHLQGSYQRTALHLIRGGEIS